MTHDVEQARIRLHELCDRLSAYLAACSLDDLTTRPAPGAWSRLEIVGHLLDSATTNHQRIIRAQYEHAPFLPYDQDRWVALNDYQHVEPEFLIDLWHRYNVLLVHVIGTIPHRMYANEVRVSADTTIGLDRLIIDYVQHLEHHVHQIESMRAR